MGNQGFAGVWFCCPWFVLNRSYFALDGWVVGTPGFKGLQPVCILIWSCPVCQVVPSPCSFSLLSWGLEGPREAGPGEREASGSERNCHGAPGAFAPSEGERAAPGPSGQAQGGEAWAGRSRGCHRHGGWGGDDLPKGAHFGEDRRASAVGHPPPTASTSVAGEERHRPLLGASAWPG